MPTRGQKRVGALRPNGPLVYNAIFGVNVLIFIQQSNCILLYRKFIFFMTRFAHTFITVYIPVNLL